MWAMESSVFELRKLRKDDFYKWKELCSIYLYFYDSEVTELVYETTFGRLVSEDNKAQNAIVACEHTEIIGLVHFIFHPDNWNIEDDCYLQDLFVVEPARGRGVGRSLIEAVYVEADKRGSPSVYWLTEETNKKAKALQPRMVGSLIRPYEAL